jgi:hypothetical protein
MAELPLVSKMQHNEGMHFWAMSSSACNNNIAVNTRVRCRCMCLSCGWSTMEVSTLGPCPDCS